MTINPKFSYLFSQVNLGCFQLQIHFWFQFWSFLIVFIIHLFLNCLTQFVFTEIIDCFLKCQYVSLNLKLIFYIICPILKFYFHKFLSHFNLFFKKIAEFFQPLTFSFQPTNYQLLIFSKIKQSENLILSTNSSNFPKSTIIKDQF